VILGGADNSKREGTVSQGWKRKKWRNMGAEVNACHKDRGCKERKLSRVFLFQQNKNFWKNAVGEPEKIKRGKPRANLQ